MIFSKTGRADNKIGDEKMKRLRLVFLLLTLGGCVGPLIPVVRLDEQSAIRLREEIRIFELSELADKQYRRLGQLQATSCMNKIWDPPATKEDALDQLRHKASSLGGNGITNAVCEGREGTNVAKNCWNSVTCYGVAVAVGLSGQKSSSQSQPAARSAGTGFVVSQNGHVLTNQHVIDSCSLVTVSISGVTLNAQVVREDSINDLALLKVAQSNLEPLPFRTVDRLRAGESIIALGYPLAGFLANEVHVTTGSITALAGVNDDTRFVQISAPVQPGNSGGPLLDSNGNIVGIVVAKLDAIRVAKLIGDIPQNVNFALNVGVIKTFLDANAIRYPSEDKDLRRAVADIAEKAKRSTAYIQCSKAIPPPS